MDLLPKRNILIAVDDSKDGDEFHLFHVIAPGTFMVVAPDMGLDGIIEEDQETNRKAEENVKAMLAERFADQFRAKEIPFKLELMHFATGSDSIGAMICQRAEQLEAAAVVMAKHNKGRLKEFFVGSVTTYCTNHCRVPLLIMHCDE